ncbi:MAG: PilZ domain-containing protein [Terriglobales bacterium]
MDSHIHPEQPGLPSDPGKNDEGVNYLRRLKGGQAEPAAVEAKDEANAGGEGETGAAVEAGGGWKERRQSPRLRCSGSAEFRTEGSDARMWGTLTDISLHGCYVEMNTTFPIETKVELVLKSCGIRIEVTGTVRTSYAFLGMGICFAEMEPEQKSQLKQLLASLGGQGAFFKGAPSAENNLNEALLAVDPRAMVDAVTEFFRKNQLLSRDEFVKIAKQVRQP